MFRVPPLPLHLDTYEGWLPAESSPRIAKVSNSISPADMWTHFISQRRPVIIDGLLQDPEWNASRWTDLQYLKSAAGDIPVKIEPVHPDAGHFGTSVKRKKVKFSEFLDILQDTESAGKWYLTTQYVEEGDEQQQGPQSSTVKPTKLVEADSDESDYEPEMDNVLPAPTNALSNDFPAKPDLLGNLVLQQCNLWLGNSKEGKSSGLHHDFHDNLYILLSGYKRFLLFPPSAHRYLHPRGFVDRVHRNGLIVYTPPGELPSYVPVPGRKLQLPIRPDGLVPSDAARWRHKARLRVKREIDELAAADAGEGSRSKSERKGKAKQTRPQELAEEALLQAEAELRICLMDEQGIDPEADTSDDDFDFDQDSNQGLDDLLSSLVHSNGNQLNASSGEEEFTEDQVDADSDDDDDEQEDDDDDDDDDDDQARRLLASLPAPVKHIGVAALAGDAASIVQLRAYLESVAESDHSGHGQASSAEQDESSGESASENANDQSHSEGEEETPSEKDEHDPDTPLPEPAASHGLALKRKEVSSSYESHTSDPEDDQQESDTVESDDLPAPAKRVKIASRVEQVLHTPVRSASRDSESGSEDISDHPHELISSEDDEDSDEPGFLPADSGSEFGDVDDGEAELEKLLAMAGQNADALASPDAPDNEDENEPQSFSRIPPHVLHRCLDIPDDPSRPMPKEANGNAPQRKKRAPSSESYSLMPGCPLPIEVFLKPGQMLYLPASWYHEVTSSSIPPLGTPPNPSGQAEDSSKVHMALNYWFHPPDALEFEPVEPTARARSSNDIVVPGLGVGLGESAIEHRGAGTGTHERPYRDAEVWDEVAHAVAQQIQLARDGALK
ncbi:hypothetical protein EX895_001123 [Sporisorium graminicola]|uniref:JmjC domain-containing protein n=1 Tax=Sporisorium graminicola TaxID=280036 RepID=A0A4U7KZI9_9BASI|nr:hypothetical protein EX895_001123 [Sporisorium graminicola]TKY89826.1 hypothetical protein EX895_001123 [Sporisorium graminicola]